VAYHGKGHLKGSHGNAGRRSSSRGFFSTGWAFLGSTSMHCHFLQTAACSPNWVKHTPDCLAQWGVHPGGHDGASNQRLPSYSLSGKTVQQGPAGLGGPMVETCACTGESVKLVPVRINSSGAARTGASFMASSFSCGCNFILSPQDRARRHRQSDFGSWKAICTESLPSGLTTALK
jgi:hypothetical protein